jgi:hypothetical protein
VNNQRAYAEAKEAEVMENAVIQSIAVRMWADFDQNERTLARFGMFPAGKMQAEEKAYVDAGIMPRRDFGKNLAVALMDQAKANGGMRA